MCKDLWRVSITIQLLMFYDDQFISKNRIRYMKKYVLLGRKGYGGLLKKIYLDHALKVTAKGLGKIFHLKNLLLIYFYLDFFVIF